MADLAGRPNVPIRVPADAQARYIKLGAGGSWETECLTDSLVRFGFGTGDPEAFDYCRKELWDKFAEYRQSLGVPKGAATRDQKQAQAFFTDDGNLVWIVFIGEQLYWGHLDPAPAEVHPDGDGTFRRVAGGWHGTDTNGVPLLKYRLSGKLTTVEMFQGTSCWIMGDARDYLLRRINGEPSEDARSTTKQEQDLRESVARLITHLGPRDFETLVDLAFASSGWRRLGPVGGPVKTRDIALELPVPRQRAFVQVKGEAEVAVLAKYIADFHAMGDTYDQFFFVYHTRTGTEPIETTDPKVTVVGPRYLAPMVIGSGLVDWLIDLVY